MIRFAHVVLSVICLTVLSACQKQGEETTNGGFVVDDLGNRIAIESEHPRIVSLAPSITESLYALALDSLLVGVTTYCNYPGEAQKKTRVGDLLTPSVEMIISLKPDVVLMSVEGNTRHTYDKLLNLGVNVFVTNPKNMDGVLSSITKLGALLSAEDRSAKVVEELRAKGQSVNHDTSGQSRPGVLFLISMEPLIAIGAESFIGEILTRAGCRNIGAVFSGSYPVVSREEVLRQSPDIVFVSSDLGTSESALLARFPEWRSIPAIKDHFVVTVNGDMFMRPGPRSFHAVELVRELVSVWRKTKGLSNT